MQRDHSRLVHRTTANTTKLLHMRTHTQQQAHMHTERPDIRASLAADPEDTQVALIVELDDLALVDAADAQLALDGGNEGRALEQSAGEGLESASELGLAALDLVVQADDADVLLSGTLLGLDEASGAVDADDEAAGDLGIEGTAVAGLFASA